MSADLNTPVTPGATPGTGPGATHTVALHRVLCAPPERVYRAFLDPHALAKWLPPHGFTCQVHSLEARVGGQYRMSFHQLGNGQAHSFGGSYLELVPGQLLRYTAVFDDPQLPGEMLDTIRLTAVPSGTDLHITQAGIPGVIPVDGCYVGWQQSLALLALLVEAQVPG